MVVRNWQLELKEHLPVCYPPLTPVGWCAFCTFKFLKSFGSLFVHPYWSLLSYRSKQPFNQLLEARLPNTQVPAKGSSAIQSRAPRGSAWAPAVYPKAAIFPGDGLRCDRHPEKGREKREWSNECRCFARCYRGDFILCNAGAFVLFLFFYFSSILDTSISCTSFFWYIIVKPSK